MEWRRKGWLCDCVWSSDTHVYLGLKLNATAKYNHGTEFVDEFNTVLFAIGRDTCTAKIWLEGVGVAPNPKHGKLLHNELERSGVDNIYAIGDVLGGKRELTPVAIQVGKRLARRLVRI